MILTNRLPRCCLGFDGRRGWIDGGIFHFNVVFVIVVYYILRYFILNCLNMLILK